MRTNPFHLWVAFWFLFAVCGIGCVVAPKPPTTTPAPPVLARPIGTAYVVEVFDPTGKVMARWLVPPGGTIQWPHGTKQLPLEGK